MEFQFESVQAFFWMKGHGPYVWASYIITFIGIIFLIIFPRQQRKQLFKLLRANRMRKDAVNSQSTTPQQPDEPKAE